MASYSYKMSSVQNKETTLKVIQKHQVIYKGKLIRITTDLSAEILKARRASWTGVFQVLKQSNCQPRILLSFKINGKYPKVHLETQKRVNRQGNTEQK
jgi:hypothetical protein